jgi:DNA-binding NarL/FixJ family response regulator
MQRPNTKKIQVLLVDDHDFFRNGLKLGLERYGDEIEVIGTASDGKEAIAKVRTLIPDVVIMDIRMPEMDGITASTEIQKISHALKILALSMHNEREYCLQLINAGVKGILFKHTPIETIVEAIRTIHHDKYYFSD